MCEQCRYTNLEVIRTIVSQARPEQVIRLLRDIRKDRPEGDTA